MPGPAHMFRDMATGRHGGGFGHLNGGFNNHFHGGHGGFNAGFHGGPFNGPVPTMGNHHHHQGPHAPGHCHCCG